MCDVKYLYNIHILQLMHTYSSQYDNHDRRVLISKLTNKLTKLAN